MCQCLRTGRVVSNWQLRPDVDSSEGSETENLVSQSHTWPEGRWRDVVVACCFIFLSKRTFFLNVFGEQRVDFRAVSGPRLF